MLSDREMKFLESALGQGPSGLEGEADNAAVMFFRSLRKRSVTVTQFTSSFASTNGSGAPPPVKSKPDYGMCVMPWRKSKHYGKMFMDIPPHDLVSSLRWIKEDETRAKQFKTLADQIQNFLDQGKP